MLFFLNINTITDDGIKHSFELDLDVSEDGSSFALSFSIKIFVQYFQLKEKSLILFPLYFVG